MLGRVLKEIRNVRQEPIAGRRRWFDDDMIPLELIVWYSAAGAVDGFQICYDFGGGERALTWWPTVGFSHRAVDSGSANPFSNQTPILVADGSVPWAEVTKRFEECGASLEPVLRDFVGQRLTKKS